MYTANWSAATPGCLIFLLDQSESMEEPLWVLSGRTWPKQMRGGEHHLQLIFG